MGEYMHTRRWYRTGVLLEMSLGVDIREETWEAFPRSGLRGCVGHGATAATWTTNPHGF